MRFLQAILYGLVSGFTELIPVSGSAHRALAKYLFGAELHQPALDILVHIGALLAIVLNSLSMINRLRREQHRPRRRHHRTSAAGFDLRLIKTAAVPMIAGLVLGGVVSKPVLRLPLIALGSLIFGTLFLATDYMRQGNKTARDLSALDSVAIGLGGALSAFPGVSRVGMMLAVATARGADKRCAYSWSLLLSIPALVVLIGIELVSVFTVGIGALSLGLLISYLFAGLFAFAGGCAAVSFMHYLSVRIGYSGIAYYNLGVAVFSFILYLIV